jgi:hypothetical protein
VLAVLARAGEQGPRITIPATALAQAIRNPDRQSRLSRLIRQPSAGVVPLGIVLAQTGTSDAHVSICARRAGAAVVASDASDLRRIAPDLRIVEV